MREVESVSGFESVSPSDADKTIFEALSGLISSVVWLFIAMAAVIAGGVLMNLTSMYVMQKKHEMTIMRINGFSTGEVIRYVCRETVLTTITGIVLGIAAGSLMGYSIVRTVEYSYIQFERGISIPAWLFATLITALFALTVNFAALRKVRHLKLTDMS